MYVQKASIEDLTDIIKLLRDEAYSHWDNKRLSYTPNVIENTLRERFHKDYFYTATNNGRTIGFLWLTLLKISGQNKTSLFPIAIIMKHKDANIAEAKTLLFNEARRTALREGLMQKTMNELEKGLYFPYYSGPGFSDTKGEKEPTRTPWKTKRPYY